MHGQRVSASENGEPLDGDPLSPTITRWEHSLYPYVHWKAERFVTEAGNVFCGVVFMRRSISASTSSSTSVATRFLRLCCSRRRVSGNRHMLRQARARTIRRSGARSSDYLNTSGRQSISTRSLCTSA